MLCKGGQLNYCLPCLQMKLQVWQGASSEVGGRQEVEEMGNFRKVKALWGSGLTDEQEEEAVCQESRTIEVSE